MKKAFDAKTLVAEIPQIAQIKNEEWREKTIKAWELAYADSNFEELTPVLFSPFYPNPTLLGHTRAVTAASIFLAQNLIDEHHYDIDLDAVIVISVLHDISKLREYNPTSDGGIEKSEIGRTYQHAFFSAHYAVKVGLPDKIVAAIFSHTGNTKTLPTSLEAIIVTYADMVDADAHRFLTERPMHVAKLHKN